MWRFPDLASKARRQFQASDGVWAASVVEGFADGAVRAGYQRPQPPSQPMTFDGEDRLVILTYYTRDDEREPVLVDVSVFKMHAQADRVSVSGLASDLSTAVYGALARFDDRTLPAPEPPSPATAASIDKGAARAAIESLYGEVLLGLIDNDLLKALIADLTAQLATATGELAEAQSEVKTLVALHAQLERQNEALLKELSKGIVQPESASLLARGIKFGAVSLVSFAITVGGTYAGTKAALPDDQVAQLQVTQQTIVNRCDQVIQVVGEGG